MDEIKPVIVIFLVIALGSLIIHVGGKVIDKLTTVTNACRPEPGKCVYDGMGVYCILPARDMVVHK